mgnify:CR=1 FL=1
MDDIGKKLQDRRKELNLTLEEVGKAVGVGKSTVRKWENGIIKNMGRDKIAKLASVLKISPVDLVPMPENAQAENDLRLEALHQNPRLGLLFDRTRKMSTEDVDFMIQLADKILKERDQDEQ